MTKKQKAMVAIWIVVIVIVFVFLSGQFLKKSSDVEFTPDPVMLPVSPSAQEVPETMPVNQATPEMPDDVADDVLLNDSDFSSLDEEENGETEAVDESIQTIDDITNAYDEQQL